MDTRIALAACGAALLASLVGCSSQDAGGTGKVALNGNDVGAVTGVQCAVDGERTTVTLDGAQKTTVVLNGAQTPAVESVNIGEVGSGGAALAYLQGVSAAPAEVTHDDATGYRVKGTGMGTDPASPDMPVDMPFEIEATCPS